MNRSALVNWVKKTRGRKKAKDKRKLVITPVSTVGVYLSIA